MIDKHRNKATRGAFTLIEILVVLVIMGFLVALVAPKLSGIVASAVDVNCDTNQERLRKVLNVHVSQNNALPSELLNLVVIDEQAPGARTAAQPSVNDHDKSNGAEFFADEFVDRFKPQIHYLDDDEKDELTAMGVKGFKYAALADTSGAGFAVGDVHDPATFDIVETFVNGNMEQPRVPVLMAGVGFNDPTDSDVVAWSTGNTVTVTGSAVVETDAQLPINDASLSTNANADGIFARMDEGVNTARILMGLTSHGELIQTGMLDEAGICPGQLQNADHFEYGNYVVVLPRLEATMNRLAEAMSVDEVTLHAIALNVDSGDNATGNTIGGRTPADGQPYFKAQSVENFTTSCPEGHVWGSNSESYAISIK